MNKILCALAALLASQAAGAAITVRDDDGNQVTLQKPAQRVIAMAPHVTEMLFAAGGGDKIVGTVTYSDYPEAAKKLPRVGDNRQVDMERIASLKPDLIVIWMHGSSERQIDTLRKLGIPLFHSEPKKLADIPDNMQRLGQLLGTEAVADKASAEWRDKLTALTAQYAKRPPVRVFYQVWDKPLYTLSGNHIISDVMRVCGGENVFASLKITAPVVDVEGVLREDPEAVFATAEKNYGGVDLWRPYKNMKAVKHDNLFTLEGDLLNRSGPRLIQGTALLCEKLELARQHRKN
ncbi:cobalamin-binding protein [Pseudoduganella namucuonensis]|uniref:Iron complex transport system substrate-binding protein n=1 Tax=Pseudoduganella namucuonensis TaxID=1035707 RepID=A0A1I7M6N0_9BURK|nr:cobalamin-binding protein [Pseudoduganella namucuonensis]SFV17576.1 iron complex transport system substrate-binding protein [Pseudoduganella namucuonensis]